MIISTSEQYCQIWGKNQT